MKTYKITTLMFMFFVVFSCTNNDENNLPEEPSQEFDGSWTLINIRGGILGINDDYPPNVIIWEFDSENSLLTIQNDYIVDTYYSGLESGIYNFSIQDVNQESFLFIEGHEFGHIEVINNELTINQNHATLGVINDGFIILLQ